MVVNVLPKGAPTKGTALERARRLLACDFALYVGDDETDEDVFGIHSADRLLSVRVGGAAGSRATFCLKHQGEIDQLLRRLIALRSEMGRPDAGQYAAAVVKIAR
jgi:trehalose 6-phosphate phosphatase